MAWAATLAGTLLTAVIADPAPATARPAAAPTAGAGPTAPTTRPGAPIAGYGRFPWGTDRAAVEAVEPGLTAWPGAEPVAFEAEAIARIIEDERRRAQAAGKDAFAAWKARPEPQPRLWAGRYWVTLEGLPGRVELRFVDDQLYAATVRLLYRAGQKPQAARVLDSVLLKYGAPLEPEAGRGPIGARPRLAFALPVGRLEVLRHRPRDPRDRGMVRLHYRGGARAEAVDRYLEGLRGRLRVIERAAAPPPPPAEATAPPQGEPDPLMQHL